jgi:hypothetical protein
LAGRLSVTSSRPVKPTGTLTRKPTANR